MHLLQDMNKDINLEKETIVMKFLRILVTNQPDVRKRLVSPEVWAEMQNRVMNLGFDCAYICPHLTGDNCDCKKPKPGMLLAAAKRWNLDLPSCYMIGDTAAETGAARNTGCKSILIRASYNEGIKSDCVAEDLLNAVLLIWKLERGRL